MRAILKKREIECELACSSTARTGLISLSERAQAQMRSKRIVHPGEERRPSVGLPRGYVGLLPNNA